MNTYFKRSRPLSLISLCIMLMIFNPQHIQCTAFFNFNNNNLTQSYKNFENTSIIALKILTILAVVSITILKLIKDKYDSEKNNHDKKIAHKLVFLIKNSNDYNPKTIKKLLNLLSKCYNPTSLRFKNSLLLREKDINLLGYFIRYNKENLIRTLLKTPNAQEYLEFVNKYNYNILDYIAMQNNSEITSLILNALGPSLIHKLSQPSNDKLTPFCEALSLSNIQTAQLILNTVNDKQAFIRSAHDKNNNNPLHLLCDHGRKSVKALLDIGFKKDSFHNKDTFEKALFNYIILPNKTGQTAVHVASYNEDFKVANILLNKISNQLQRQRLINIPDNKGNTILHITLKYSRLIATKQIALLLEQGASLYQKNLKSQTPYEKAVKKAKSDSLIAHKILKICNYYHKLMAIRTLVSTNSPFGHIDKAYQEDYNAIAQNLVHTNKTIGNLDIARYIANFAC